MLKILQARLQQYVNRELPDVHTSPSSVMLAVVYFEDSFHQVKGILFYSKFAEIFFIMNERWVL